MQISKMRNAIFKYKNKIELEGSTFKSADIIILEIYLYMECILGNKDGL